MMLNVHPSHVLGCGEGEAKQANSLSTAVLTSLLPPFFVSLYHCIKHTFDLLLLFSFVKSQGDAELTLLQEDQGDR